MIRLDDDQVVERADETAVHRHVAAVADVDAVRVGAVAEQFGVLDRHAVGLADGDRPGAGVPQDHAFDPDVLAADQQQVPRVRRAVAPVHDPASAEDDLLALQREGRRVGLQPAVAADAERLVGLDHAAHDRAARNVDGLAAGHGQTADFVDAGAEVNDVGVVRTRHVGLRRIPEQVQAPTQVSLISTVRCRGLSS